MKGLITVAIGMYLGHRMAMTIAEARSNAKTLAIRENLEHFLRENMAGLSADEAKEQASRILKTNS